MLDKIKSTRLNITSGALLTLVMGLLLLVWPGEIITSMAWVAGLIVALVGATHFFGHLLSGNSGASGMLVGALVTAVGVLILINPVRAASVVPVILGVVLVMHGIQNIRLAFVGKSYRMPHWGVILVGGILNVAFGAVCIVCAFTMLTVVFRLSGAMLIYDGLASILAVRHINRYEAEYIDVTYREL